MTGRTPEPVRAFIGLGSNLDDPPAQLARARAALGALPDSRLVMFSSLYRSPPMGPVAQPAYLNAVAVLDTRLDAHALLDHLQGIEQAHGRVRAERWGARTLDLDLLLYGLEKISSPRLTVPHPGLPERAFVLYPLAELAPDLDVPGHGPVATLAARVAAAGIQRLDEGRNRT